MCLKAFSVSTHFARVLITIIIISISKKNASPLPDFFTILLQIILRREKFLQLKTRSKK